MADRRNEHFAPEGVNHQPLQHLAVDVAAHSTRARWPPGSSSASTSSSPASVQAMGRMLRGFQHLRIRGAGIAGGAQKSTDTDHSGQTRHPRPDIEAAPGNHDVVGGTRPAAFGGEHDDVPLAGENSPADCDLGGVESISGIGIRTVAIAVTSTRRDQRLDVPSDDTDELFDIDISGWLEHDGVRTGVDPPCGRGGDFLRCPVSGEILRSIQLPVLQLVAHPTCRIGPGRTHHIHDG